MPLLDKKFTDRLELLGLVPLLDKLHELERFGITDILPLPDLCCQALGGDRALSANVTAAWGLLYTAAHILDQISDEDALEGKHGLLATLAAASVPIARLLLDAQDSNLAGAKVKNDILVDFDCTLLLCANGQIADLSQTGRTLDETWEIARAKTGEMFAVACRSGARLAGAPGMVIKRMGDFGSHLGALVQVGDDINSLWPQPDEASDLARGRWTLPVAYAAQVGSPDERNWLVERLKTAGQSTAVEDELRKHILESGAMLYLAAETKHIQQKAEKALREVLPSADSRQELESELTRVSSWILDEIQIKYLSRHDLHSR